MIHRRDFLFMLAAPAVIRIPGLLMPIQSERPDVLIGRFTERANYPYHNEKYGLDLDGYLEVQFEPAVRDPGVPGYPGYRIVGKASRTYRWDPHGSSLDEPHDWRTWNNDTCADMLMSPYSSIGRAIMRGTAPELDVSVPPKGRFTGSGALII